MNAEEKQKDALWAVCKQFIEKQKISCAETIYQCDWVIENAYAFIKSVCDVAGYYRYPDEDED